MQLIYNGVAKKNMKRTISYILVALAAFAIFAGLVHAVLVTAQVSEPAATTIYGPTTRRIWASAAAILALASVIMGMRNFRQSAGAISPTNTKIRIFVAILLGLIAVVNAILNLAFAKGGPGTGNGVVGAAAALVLGLLGIVLGILAFTRNRRNVKA
jgi:peptidoglycan/LPS O-acetylase OafA/YrhL